MFAGVDSFIQQSLARCRVILTFVALCAVYVDPTEPIITRRIPLTYGPYTIDPLVLTIMGAYLGYGLFMLARLRVAVLSPRAVMLATWTDVGFAAAIGVVTEGGSSPFFSVFCFAAMEAALTVGIRRTLSVTAASAAFYACLILVSAPDDVSIYLTRLIYTVTAGYLIGYFVQQRLNLVAIVRELTAAAERQQIARDLHDVRAQVLAGISLGLGSCREMLQRQRYAEALVDLSDLQASVDREHDDLRAYMRTLINGDVAGARSDASAATRFSIRAQFDGSGTLVEHVLQILREGVTNVMRHSHATSANLRVDAVGEVVIINIDDDGVGFATPEQQPWVIASRVTTLGGALRRAPTNVPGAHLAITLPAR